MSAAMKFALSMAIFGSVGYFSAKTNLPSIELVFIRCICACVVLSLVYLFSNKKKEAVEKKEIGFSVLCGVFLVVNWVFFFRSFEHMSVTVAVSIYHLAPVLVVLLGSFLYREKITLKVMLTVITCFIGTLLVGGMQDYLSLESLMSAGLPWAFGAALFYALTTLMGKKISKLNPILTTIIQTGVGVLMLLPLVQWDYFSQLTGENWFYILLTGIVHTGFVYYLFFSSLPKLSSGTIAILVFIDPAVAIFMDIVLTAYRPDFLQIIGILLIFWGQAHAALKRKVSESGN
ncbi:EamA/RhaT family transporter [Niallia circulans]|jgi:drug/metabolite transporter (DMT)-like permease|uniref:Transporter n=1 Tax=Niallia circulans TaxID=1397 RepID=A0A0J1IJD0_NIACI|nr:DMT family transporter [Niallia circulans]KLV26051.1 transporter [Niallia circulans]MCM2981443.1 DMT family transporter [Niallia circulans]MDR4318758.1 DMT family transporter [Niallia circulans]MED3840015.1 DMT family transporter [Niallia circulans]MED4245804.1 DMT family transporter [Niallia circulans]